MSTPDQSYADRIAGLSDEQRELLRRRLAQRGQSGPPPIAPRPQPHAPAPLSFSQERLWFLEQLEPGTGAYHIFNAFRFSGALDPDALEGALNAVVARHEALRTTFAAHDGRPAQVIAPALALPLARDDLSALPPHLHQAEVERLTALTARTPFDLARGPLLRCHLLRLGPQEHVLLLAVHHLVFDGWSIGVLLRELLSLYTARCGGPPAALPDLPIQYADYAVWQREQLGGLLAEQLAYWRRQLDGAEFGLALPTDFARPQVQTFRGARHHLAVDPPLAAQLAELARAGGATLYMVLLAAFVALLARYTGQRDIAVGTFAANRNRPETEPLLGFFVNNLVLRTDLSGDPSFRALLARVREVALGAFANQDLPIEQLVEALQPERSQSHWRLFQAMFLMQSQQQVAQAPGLLAEPLALAADRSFVDLTLAFAQTPAALGGYIEYNPDLFAPATVERMAGHLLRLLAQVAADPDRPILDTPLLPDQERRLVVEQWNATAADGPPEGCLHSLFAAQARATPEAVALIEPSAELRAPARHLTFGALERRANQLAHVLRERGVGPEERVGICMDHSAELVVAMLAVHKAGGAYVALDPKTPAERLRALLADAGARLLLADGPLDAGCPLLDLRAAAALIDTQPAGPPQVAVGPANLAYVIYTSGSTGQPKGVLCDHAGILARFAWMWQRYPFAPDDVCCLKASISFIDSVWETFWPLLRGAPVVVVPGAAQMDPPALIGLLARQRVTRVVLVPALLSAILDSDGVAAQLAALRCCENSGEALAAELAARFARRLPGCTLLNTYGSSEVGGEASWCDAGEWRSGGPAQVPIGRPIANTAIYVLDQRMAPTPIGVPGEIYVGGAGLARGYLGQTGLTAERFVPDPFAVTADDRRPTTDGEARSDGQPRPAGGRWSAVGGPRGARLYRTGDLGRWLPGGQVEFLGRADQQIKLRGFRVEPGEIVAVLLQQPAVREALVLADGAGAARRLVAYVTPHAAAPLDPAALRRALRERLPEYMVPSAIVALPTLPLNSHGKVDRRALPPAEDAHEAAGAAPATPLEQELAAIWSALLGRAQVGRDDSFFDVGGHSLLITQMLARVRATYGVDVPLQTFYAAPTLRDLAGQVEAALLAQADPAQLLALLEQLEQAGDAPDIEGHHAER